MSSRKRGAAKKLDASGPAVAAASTQFADEPFTKTPIVSTRRIVTRAALSLALVGVLYISAKWKHQSASASLAGVAENLTLRSQAVPCSEDYVEERRLFSECAPRKCGRVVSDSVVTANEVLVLLRIAQRGLSLGRSDGGASILDLHSGLLKHKGKLLFTEEDLKVYRQVKIKIRSLIAFQFGATPESLHLTHPTFFSEMTDRPALTVHDQYWHVHVDKKTYGSFHYTSLLYLSDYATDFDGGRLVFVDGASGNVTVEPKKGRVLAFTSGSGNPHRVEQVERGVRYALTVSFSCDPSKAIADPGMSSAAQAQNK
uniref:Putative prolyl 4-hydroxylase alpha subunit logues n=1 Tax=Ixodes ricinus TaxID=34613 RepID=A0A0K8R6H5_IXORI